MVKARLQVGQAWRFLGSEEEWGAEEVEEEEGCSWWTGGRTEK